MTLILGSLGWGLYLAGAISHLQHFDRLVDLLLVHTTRPLLSARLLVAAEVALVALFGASALAGWTTGVVAASIAGLALGIAFTVWVGRLLLSGSDLPCACSFSSAPTSKWSLLRAAGTITIGIAMFSAGAAAGDAIAALTVGAAAGLALFIVPDALAWPEASEQLRAVIRAGDGSTVRR